MKRRRKNGLRLGTAPNAVQMERILDEKLYWFYNELISVGTNASNTVLPFNVPASSADCVILKFIVNTFRASFFADFQCYNKAKKKKKTFQEPILPFVHWIFDKFNVALSFNKSECYDSEATLTLLSYLKTEFNLPTVRERNLRTYLWKSAQRDVFHTRRSEKPQGSHLFFLVFSTLR